MSPASSPARRLCIDLNADVGEQPERLSDGREAALVAQLSSANLACGGHAGDATSMRAVIALCRVHGVAIGAHPSYPDRQHFGRRPLALPRDELLAQLTAQVKSLAQLAAEQGASLSHVKPHGALYHAAADEAAVAGVLIDVIKQVDPQLFLVGRAGSLGLALARAAGLSVLAEGFADRRYTATSELVDRRQPGALLTDPAAVCAQALSLILDGKVQPAAGSPLPLHVDTLCLHSDTPGAEALATQLRAALQQAGLRIAPPRRE